MKLIQAINIMKKQQRGLLIALEGLDRCGKSTQAKILEDKLKAHRLSFPDRKSSIGTMISQYLKGSNDLNDQVIHLLFSANRWEKQEFLIEQLNQGINIVCDRYAFSGVAFSAAKGLDINWCKSSDTNLPRPDITFFLQAPLKLLSSKAEFGGERYENIGFQANN
ncbi:hypothetical protein pb186bvf_013768 [Paramecium bursaria]